MGKTKILNVEIPSIPVFFKDVLPVRMDTLKKYMAMRKRVRKYFSSRKNLQTTARYNEALNRLTETEKDLIEEIRDLAQRRSLIMLMKMAKKKGLDCRDVTNTYGLITSMLKSELKRFPEIKQMIRKGAFIHELKDLLPQHAEATQVHLSYMQSDIKASTKTTAHAFIDATFETIEKEFDDWQFMMMHDPSLDPRMMDEAAAGNLETGDLSPEQVDKLETFANKSKRRLSQLDKEATSLYDKIRGAQDSFIEPLFQENTSEEDNPLDDTSTPDIFTDTLVAVQIAKFRNLFFKGPYKINVEDGFANIEEDGRNFLLDVARSAEFWFAGIYLTLVKTGAMDEKSCFKPWVPELLIETMDRPGKLKKFHITQEGQKAKSALNKMVVPCLRGVIPTQTDSDEISADSIGAEDLLSIISVVCACQINSMINDKEQSLSPKSRKGIEKMWLDIVGPHSELILSQLVFDTEHALASDEDGMFDWEDKAEAELIMSQPDEDIAEITTIEPDRNWFYVTNPAAPKTNIGPVQFTDDSDTDLDIFLRKNKIKAIIKPNSILSALDYFVDLPESTRALMPHEQIESESWHKLKRGKIRILARLEKDRLLFNIYPRKEWVRRG